MTDFKPENNEIADLTPLSSEFVILRNMFLLLLNNEEWHKDLLRHEKRLFAFGRALDRFNDHMQTQMKKMYGALQSNLVEQTIVAEIDSTAVAIPLVDVASIQPFSQMVVTKVGHGLTVQYEDQTVRVINFQQLVGSLGDGSVSKNDESPVKTVVVLRANGHFLAIIVDSIKSQLEAVVRPFDKLIGSVPAFKGTTTLDDDRIAYVLDASNFVTTSKETKKVSL